MLIILTWHLWVLGISFLCLIALIIWVHGEDREARSRSRFETAMAKAATREKAAAMAADKGSPGKVKQTAEEPKKECKQEQGQRKEKDWWDHPFFQQSFTPGSGTRVHVKEGNEEHWYEQRKDGRQELFHEPEKEGASGKSNEERDWRRFRPATDMGGNGAPHISIVNNIHCCCQGGRASGKDAEEVSAPDPAASPREMNEPAPTPEKKEREKTKRKKGPGPQKKNKPPPDPRHYRYQHEDRLRELERKVARKYKEVLNQVKQGATNKKELAAALRQAIHQDGRLHKYDRWFAMGRLLFDEDPEDHQGFKEDESE